MTTRRDTIASFCWSVGGANILLAPRLMFAPLQLNHMWSDQYTFAEDALRPTIIAQGWKTALLQALDMLSLSIITIISPCCSPPSFQTFNVQLPLKIIAHLQPSFAQNAEMKPCLTCSLH